MSMPRSAALPPLKKGHCRWCGDPLPRGRRAWCGDACVEDFRIRSWPAYARARVFARDGGVCSACGLDCYRLQFGYGPEVSKEMQTRYVTDTGGHGLRRDIALRVVSFANLRVLLRGLGLTTRIGAALWEADHIRPVVEGGGACGLENLRTLCWECHRLETAKLAKRRAAQRRQQAAADAGQTDMWGWGDKV